MQIKLGMPEILVLFSLLMYSQNLYFSLTAFSFGLLGRIIEYLIVYGAEMKKVEATNKNIDELGTVIKDMLGDKKD